MRDGFRVCGVDILEVHRRPGTEQLTRVLKRTGLIRHLRTLDPNVYVAPVHTTHEGALFPHSYFARCVTFSFDVWPYWYALYERIFARNRIPLAFLSSRQAVEHFSKTGLATQFHWCPEAIDARAFKPQRPFADRAIDVLELGRKHEPYHRALAAGAGGLRHVHSSDRPGHLVFPDQAALVDGLADTRVMICFPRAMTDAAAGGVETVTLRYFEGMASKCLLVGRAPQELVDLFGFDPVIEADLHDPAGQIAALIADPQACQTIVDRNYARLLEVGTWTIRARQMIDTIRLAGLA